MRANFLNSILWRRHIHRKPLKSYSLVLEMAIFNINKTIIVKFKQLVHHTTLWHILNLKLGSKPTTIMHIITNDINTGRFVRYHLSLFTFFNSSLNTYLKSFKIVQMAYTNMNGGFTKTSFHRIEDDIFLISLYF